MRKRTFEHTIKCFIGKRMLLKNEKEHEEYSVKIYEGIGYSDCSLKTKCTKAKNLSSRFKRMKKQLQSDKGKEIYRLRQLILIKVLRIQQVARSHHQGC